MGFRFYWALIALVPVSALFIYIVFRRGDLDDIAERGLGGRRFDAWVF